MINRAIRRTQQRRKSDRFRLAIGLLLGLVLTGGLLQLAQCNKGGGEITGSTSVAEPSAQQPVASASPTPAPVAPVDGEQGNGRECSVDGTTLYLKNTNDIVLSYVGWSTDFDQAPLGTPNTGTAGPGGLFDRPAVRGVCEQTDIGHNKGQALCHAFFDINGKQFEPSKAPQKVSECRQDCVLSDWSGWGQWSEWYPHPYDQSLLQRVRTRTRTVTTPPAPYRAECPGLEEKEYEEKPACLKPTVAIRCAFDNDWLGGAYDCTATTNVPATFSWDPDYDPVFSALTVQACREQKTEDFRKYILTGQGIEILNAVTVSATNCECPNEGASSATWRR